MNDDEVMGAARFAGGGVESAFGTVTGNIKTELKGDVKRLKGAAQNILGRFENCFEDSVGLVKDEINAKPVQSSLVALALGYLLGRLFRS